MSITAAELNIIVRSNSRQAQGDLTALDRRIRDIAAGGMLLGVGRGMTDFFKDALVSGGEFAQNLMFVDMLAGGVGKRVDELRDKAVSLDQDLLFNSQQVMESMEQLAREGARVDQILGGWAESALHFAGATREGVVPSANLFGQVMRVYAEHGLEAADVADVLTTAVLRSGRSLAETATGFQYWGNAAALFGFDFEQAAMLSSFIASLGVKPRSAGTGLRTFFSELADPETQASLDDLGIVVKNADGTFKDLYDIHAQFQSFLGDMQPDAAYDFITKLFGKPAASPLTALFLGDFEHFLGIAEEMPTAADIMEARMDTVAGSLDRLGATWLNFKRLIGEGAGVVFKPAIDGLTGIVDALSQMPPFVLAAIGSFAGIAGAVFMLGGALRIFSAVGGFGLVAAGAAALLSPLMLLTAAVGGLALLFRGSISTAFFEVNDRLNEFGEDVQDVYNRLVGNGAGSVSAGVRAFGSALEDLTGIEMSGFFFTLGNSAEAARDRLVELRDAVASGDWAEAGQQLEFLKNIVVTGSVRLGGELEDAAQGIARWIARALGLDVQTSSTRGALSIGVPVSSQAIDVPIGSVLLSGAAVLGGRLLAVAQNFVGWLRGQFASGGYAGEGYGVGFENPTVPLGTVALSAAVDLAGDVGRAASDLAGYVYDEFLGNGQLGDVLVSLVGTVFNLADWGLKLLAPAPEQIQVAIVEITDLVTDALGLDIIVSNWTLKIRVGTDTEIDVDWLGIFLWFAGEVAPLFSAGGVFGAMFDVGGKLGDLAAKPFTEGWIFGLVEGLGKFVGWAALAITGGVIGFVSEFGPPTAKAISEFFFDIVSAPFAVAAREFAEAKELGPILADLPGNIFAALQDALRHGLTAGREVFGLGFRGLELTAMWAGVLGDIVAGLVEAAADIDWGSVPGTIANSFLIAVTGAAGVLDWAHGTVGTGGVFSKIYDSLLAGIAGIDWGGIPGALAESLWDAIVAAAATVGSVDELVKSFLTDTEEPDVKREWQDEDTQAKRAPGGRDLLAALGLGGGKNAQEVLRMPAPDFAAFDRAWQAAGALVTNVTLGIESRLGAFAAAATRWGVHAGDGWFGGTAQGFDRGGSLVTNVTLGLESRLRGFAGAAIAAAFDAGSGWANAIDFWLGQGVNAARFHVGTLQGVLARDFSNEGYYTGRSYSAAVEQGLRDGLAGARSAVAELQATAAGANAQAGSIARVLQQARQLVSGNP